METAKKAGPTATSNAISSQPTGDAVSGGSLPRGSMGSVKAAAASTTMWTINCTLGVNFRLTMWL